MLGSEISPQVPRVVRTKGPTVREGGEYENGRTLKFGDFYT